jgi:GTP cyclohydrolase I
MNRIVEYYSKRPQVQERLTMQIVQELQMLYKRRCLRYWRKTSCVNSRGISDIESSTVTLNSVENLKTHKLEESFWIILN